MSMNSEVDAYPTSSGDPRVSWTSTPVSTVLIGSQCDRSTHADRHVSLDAGAKYFPTVSPALTFGPPTQPTGAKLMHAPQADYLPNVSLSDVAYTPRTPGHGLVFGRSMEYRTSGQAAMLLQQSTTVGAPCGALPTSPRSVSRALPTSPRTVSPRASPRDAAPPARNRELRLAPLHDSSVDAEQSRNIARSPPWEAKGETRLQTKGRVAAREEAIFARAPGKFGLQSGEFVEFVTTTTTAATTGRSAPLVTYAPPCRTLMKDAEVQKSSVLDLRKVLPITTDAETQTLALVDIGGEGHSHDWDLSASSADREEKRFQQEEDESEIDCSEHSEVGPAHCFKGDAWRDTLPTESRPIEHDRQESGKQREQAENSRLENEWRQKEDWCQQAENRRIENEQRRMEQQQLLEERKRLDDEWRQLQQQQLEAEAKRLEEDRRRLEEHQRRLDKKRLDDEQRNLEQLKWQQQLAEKWRLEDERRQKERQQPLLEQRCSQGEEQQNAHTPREVLLQQRAISDSEGGSLRSSLRKSPAVSLSDLPEKTRATDQPTTRTAATFTTGDKQESVNQKPQVKASGTPGARVSLADKNAKQNPSKSGSKPQKVDHADAPGQQAFQLPVWPVYLFSVLDFMPLTMVMPVVPFYLTNQYQAGPEAFGYLMSFQFISNMIGSLIVGPLADKLGRKPVMLFIAFFKAVCLLALSVPNHSLILFFCVRFLSVLLDSTLLCMTCISELSPPEKRTMRLAWVNSGIGLSNIIGPLIVAQLTPYGNGFSPVCLVAGGLGFVNGFLGLVFLRTAPVETKGGDSQDQPSMLSMLKENITAPILACYVLIIADGTWLAIVTTCGPVYVSMAFGLDGQAYAQMMSLMGISLVASNALLIGPLVLLLGDRKLMLCSYAYRIGMVVLLVVKSVGKFSPYVFFCLMGASLLTGPCIITLISTNASPDVRGTMLTCVGVFNAIPNIVVAPIIGNVMTINVNIPWAIGVVVFTMFFFLLMCLKLPERVEVKEVGPPKTRFATMVGDIGMGVSTQMMGIAGLPPVLNIDDEAVKLAYLEVRRRAAGSGARHTTVAGGLLVDGLSKPLLGAGLPARRRQSLM